MSKSWAAHKGYFTPDPILVASQQQPPAPRAPLVSRLYGLRVLAMRNCLAAYIRGISDDGGGIIPQIVVLGAGLDSAFFYLHDLFPSPVTTTVAAVAAAVGTAAAAVDTAAVDAGNNGAKAPSLMFKYVEIDMEPVATKKSSLLGPTLLGTYSSPRTGSIHPVELAPGILSHVALEGKGYALVSADLSQPAVISMLGPALARAGLDLAAPTMFISECVLAYLAPPDSDHILQWAASTFSHPHSHFLLHEQLVHPPTRDVDPFGRHLLQYFADSGAPLPSLEDYPTLESQEKRFLGLGYQTVRACTALEYFEHVVPVEDQKRIEALEPFDEFEDWCLTASHYFFLVASRGPVHSCSFLRESLAPSQSIHELTPFSLGQQPFLEVNLRVTSEPRKGDVATQSPKRAAAGPKRPCERWGHTATLVTENTLLVYGGVAGSGRLGDSWLCNLKTQEIIELVWEGKQLEKRAYHTCTELGDGRALVFGGRAGPLRPFGDLLLLDPKRSTCQEIMTTAGEGPTPRWRHRACRINDTLFVSGGTNGQEVFGDIFGLNLVTFTWRRVGTGPPRFAHSMTPVDGNLVIHGGLDLHRRPLADLLLVNVESGHIITPLSPLPSRFSHEALLDGASLILIGGIVGNSSRPTAAYAVRMSLETRVWEPFPVLQNRLLVGHTAFLWEGKITIFGGGSTVFGNSRCYSDASSLLLLPV